MGASASSTFHQSPDALWPRLPMRQVVGWVLYVLKTGCQWKAMPREFGSGSAIHAYFQEWGQRGCFSGYGSWRWKRMTIWSASTGNGRAWTRL